MSVWTEERVKLICERWKEGCSASQIARELGDGTTRNAVIGKLLRVGFLGSGAVRPSQPKTRSTPRSRAAIAAPAPAEPLEFLGPMNDLPGSGKCRFIKGDPCQQWQCCGHPAPGISAWCDYHRTRVYDSASTRRANANAKEKSRESERGSGIRKAFGG